MEVNVGLIPFDLYIVPLSAFEPLSAVKTFRVRNVYYIYPWIRYGLCNAGDLNQ
jgi:hypothetical protein